MRSRLQSAMVAVSLLLSAACGGGSASVSITGGGLNVTGGTSGSTSQRIPLTDMGGAKYLGFSGGLYPNGNNVPADHLAAGIARAGQIQPLDAVGNPSPTGKYVLLSLGMSNTTQEWCTGGSSTTCDSWTFTGQALRDPAVNHTALVIANGAAGGKTASYWTSPTMPDYDRVRDQRLLPLGVTEKQVVAVWVKQANAGPRTSLPDVNADAYALERDLGHVLRALKVRYPNLQLVFLSSRIYGGYATSQLNPEPYAYESGFAVKWLIEAQIRQMQTGTVEAHAGDLNYGTVAPWAGWAAYLWADGMNSRSDGLTWAITDLRSDDGTHPSPDGQQKVGSLLLSFFKTSPLTQCWFVTGGACR